MKIAVQYWRISEAEQSNWSISGQQANNQDYANKKNIQIIESFGDDGVSAKNFNRPGWKALMKYLKKNYKEIDFIIVNKYCRLIRNAGDGLAILEKLENQYAVRVLSVQESINIDPNSPFFFKLRADMLVNADFERRVISDRSKFGTWNAKKAGRFIGKAPWGYLNARDADNKPIIKVDPTKSEVVKMIFEKYLEDESFTDILKAAKKQGYNRSGHDAINRMLSNPTYAGKIIVPAYKDFPEKIIDGLHDAIIDDGLFGEVERKRISKHGRLSYTKYKEIPLRGYIKCESCGNLLTGGKSRGNGGIYWYYRCIGCKGQNYPARKANNHLFSILEELSLPVEYVNKLIEYANLEFATKMKNKLEKEQILKEEVISLSTKLNRVEDKYFADEITSSTYKKWSNIYRRNLNGKKAELGELNNKNQKITELFKTELPKLSDLNSVFKACESYRKVKFLRILLGNDLRRTKTGYRTFSSQLVLPLNYLEVKHLDIIENGTLNVKNEQNPVSTRSGNRTRTP